MKKNKDIFFGLVRLNRKHDLDEDEYELYFINDSNGPVTIKRKSYGGFAAYEDTVAMAAPRDNEVNIPVEPHSSVLYCKLGEGSFSGASQYQTHIEKDGGVQILEIYLSGGAGYCGNLIPCLNRYGRSVYPLINE